MSVERSTVPGMFILKMMNLLFMCFKHNAEYVFITTGLLVGCNNRIMWFLSQMKMISNRKITRPAQLEF